MKSLLLALLATLTASPALAQGGKVWTNVGDLPAEHCQVVVWSGQICTRPGYQCWNGDGIWGCDYFPGRSQAVVWRKGDVPRYCDYNEYQGSRCRYRGERCLDGNTILQCGNY